MDSMWLDKIFAGVQCGMEHGDRARYLSADGARNITERFFVVGGRFGMGEFMGTS